jgi:hypothetical protein
MNHLITGDECEEDTQRVPKTWKPCCKAFEARTKACQYEVRVVWYGRAKWGIPIPHDGSYIHIKHCPFCGKKL